MESKAEHKLREESIRRRSIQRSPSTPPPSSFSRPRTPTSHENGNEPYVPVAEPLHTVDPRRPVKSLEGDLVTLIWTEYGLTTPPPMSTTDNLPQEIDVARTDSPKQPTFPATHVLILSTETQERNALVPVDTRTIHASFERPPILNTYLRTRAEERRDSVQSIASSLNSVSSGGSLRTSRSQRNLRTYSSPRSPRSPRSSHSTDAAPPVPPIPLKYSPPIDNLLPALSPPPITELPLPPARLPLVPVPVPHTDAFVLLLLAATGRCTTGAMMGTVLGEMAASEGPAVDLMASELLHSTGIRPIQRAPSTPSSAGSLSSRSSSPAERRYSHRHRPSDPLHPPASSVEAFRTSVNLAKGLRKSCAIFRPRSQTVVDAVELIHNVTRKAEEQAPDVIPPPPRLQRQRSMPAVRSAQGTPPARPPPNSPPPPRPPPTTSLPLPPSGSHQQRHTRN